VNPAVQVRIVVGKKDEIVTGPDDAAVVVSVARADVGIDATVAYMQGRLKATGDTGRLFDALRSGEIDAVLAAHRS
jgi:hypothetical protein